MYLSEKEKKQLEFEVVSQDLRVFFTRKIERNPAFVKRGLMSMNWLVNRSRSLRCASAYVLESDSSGGYDDAEYAWHLGEFELSLRRLDTVRFVEMIAEILQHEWLEIKTVNNYLKKESASFRFTQTNEGIAVDVFSVDQLEKDTPPDEEHPNIRLLVKRMTTGIEHKDFAAVLHASATIFETLAKDIVGIPSVQDQTLGTFFSRYEKDSQLPPELQAKVLATYQSRNKMPLAGHGSTQAPTITEEEAITLAELTKAFVRIEYTLLEKNLVTGKT